MDTRTKLPPVRDCMTKSPATVAPTDSLATVIELLRRRDIRAVPVIENEQLVGIVTDRDIRQVAPGYPLFRSDDEIEHYRKTLKVTAAMTADPMTVAPSDAMVAAAKIFETYKINSLPVVEGKRLVGMLTVTDILKVFIEQNDQSEEP